MFPKIKAVAAHIVYKLRASAEKDASSETIGKTPKKAIGDFEISRRKNQRKETK
mgnify:CR=1 FL=1